MRLRQLWNASIVAVPVAALAACSSTHAPGWGTQGTSNGTSNGTSDEAADQAALGAIQQFPFIPVCERVRPGGGMMQCHATTRVNPDGTAQTSATPSGFGPPDLRSAYNLPTSGGAGRLVAIVDAYDDPTAESDLGDVPLQYGLPACTTANGCFKKVSQTGSTTSLPAVQLGLGRRDLARPRHGQRRLPRLQDPARRGQLGDRRATSAPRSTRPRRLGAVAISNSYGGGEDSSVTSDVVRVLQPPRRPRHGERGRRRLRRRVPRDLAVRRSPSAAPRSPSRASSRGWAETVWADARQRLQRVHRQAELADATPAAPSARWPTSRPSPIPNTGVAVYDTYGGAAGRSTAARASPRRSSRPSSRCSTSRRTGPAYPVVAHRRTSTT